MKKIFLISFLGLVCVIAFLNIQVTTRQGINYKVSTLKMPLYLKAIDFYDRNFNYKWLAQKITKDKNSDRDKVMAIFEWTTKNILQQPKELPVVDDHVWHIIVRGYGTGDQFSDVFTTLCNYAGFEAFFYRLANKEGSRRITFSFVRICDKWHIFEPAAGIYFLNYSGAFVPVADMAQKNWTPVCIGGALEPEKDYTDYFREISLIDFAKIHRYSRANIQSPINRFIYGIRKYLHKTF